MQQPSILVTMVARNAARSIGDAIESVIGQRGTLGRVDLLILDDESTDATSVVVEPYSRHPHVHVRTVRGGSAWRMRNLALSIADSDFVHCDYVARLDADDRLAGPDVLAQVQDRLHMHRPDALLAANWQLDGMCRRPFPNRPDFDMTAHGSILTRLRRMSVGDTTAELPSCNLVLRRGLGRRYRPEVSAEDHWMVVELLLSDTRTRTLLAPDLVYCDYSLLGAATQCNRHSEAYLDSRRRLLDFALRLAPERGII